jgi:hypothetical protein
VSTAELERHLVRDLDQVGERLTDEELCRQLYRALANNRWRKQDGPDGVLALSWSRAERLVTDLRGRRGAEPLPLAQTGGEGQIGELVQDLLAGLGWTAEPLDTSRPDPAHVGESSESPPPRGTGEQHAPVEDSREWEREGHREAEAARLGEESAPPQSTSEGAGGGRRARSDKA